MDMDLDVMYDDVRVDEKILGFVEEEGEEEVFSKFRNFGRFISYMMFMVFVRKLEIWNPNNEVSEISEFFLAKKFCVWVKITKTPNKIEFVTNESKPI